MSKPSESEIESLASRMRSFFRISETEARNKATGLLTLAYGWGSPPSGGKLEQMIKRDLPKEFEWISESEKTRFERSEAARIEGQQAFISPRSRTPKYRS